MRHVPSKNCGNGLVLTLLCLGPLGVEGAAASSESLPNIVYILVDDMGQGDLSICGQRNFSTPNLDRMAREGMVFSNHYTGSPVSGPSRACLMTGKHTGHVSVKGNYPPPQSIRDDEQTLAHVLKDAGYVTAAIGKWGIGNPLPADDPQRKGFDYFFGYIDMWHAHNCYPEFLYRNGRRVEIKGNRLRRNPDGSNPWSDMPEGTGVADSSFRAVYAPDLFLAEALSFLSDSLQRQAPFFLYYALNLPHANNEAAPYGCEVPSTAEFDDRDWPLVEKGYASMMRIVDHHVGAIIHCIDSLFPDNTIILFASDNGPHQEGGHSMEFFDSNSYYRGMKRDVYDGGIKTPFFVRWKGVIPPGSRNNQLTAFWDILPTFAEIVGEPVTQTDGVSLLPVFREGYCTRLENRKLYFQFNEQGGKRAVVTDRWKYIELHTGDERLLSRELYAIDSDSTEQVNVYNRDSASIFPLKRFMEDAIE